MSAHQLGAGKHGACQLTDRCAARRDLHRPFRFRRRLLAWDSSSRAAAERVALQCERTREGGRGGGQKGEPCSDHKEEEKEEEAGRRRRLHAKKNLGKNDQPCEALGGRGGAARERARRYCRTALGDLGTPVRPHQRSLRRKWGTELYAPTLFPALH
ncbi:unnamed protein product [Prorocentrum cordatum]|uniref:Uncharacterized protein n=1 Tax=Prorocentrum cordatum TaxID=2364126 RepID=A0ABN9PUR8_9DINO|nr:unnamed protein product [Polarella glacialis]